MFGVFSSLKHQFTTNFSHSIPFFILLPKQMVGAMLRSPVCTVCIFPLWVTTTTFPNILLLTADTGATDSIV